MDERIRQVCLDIAQSSGNISREELKKAMWIFKELKKAHSQRGYEEQEEKAIKELVMRKDICMRLRYWRRVRHRFCKMF